MKPQAVKRSNLPVGLGLVIFGTGMALFPLWYTKSAAPQLTYKEGPLAPQATIRGAYINTASKDVGIDPDFHKYRKDPIVGNAPLHPSK
jgi:hypothetical protein